MSSFKVISIRGEAVSYDQEPLQLDLFNERSTANYFCFIDIDRFDQEDFLDVVVRHSVGAVVDLRPLPVFTSPKFDHREVTHYLYENHIAYLEYAMVKLDPDDFSPWRIARSVNQGRPKGLTLWIYDQPTKDCGWFDLAKEQLNRSKLFRAELNPRALGH